MIALLLGGSTIALERDSIVLLEAACLVSQIFGTSQPLQSILNGASQRFTLFHDRCLVNFLQVVQLGGRHLLVGVCADEAWS